MQRRRPAQVEAEAAQGDKEFILCEGRTELALGRELFSHSSQSRYLVLEGQMGFHT